MACDGLDAEGGSQLRPACVPVVAVSPLHTSNQQRHDTAFPLLLGKSYAEGPNVSVGVALAGGTSSRASEVAYTDKRVDLGALRLGTLGPPEFARHAQVRVV